MISVFRSLALTLTLALGGPLLAKDAPPPAPLPTLAVLPLKGEFFMPAPLPPPGKPFTQAPAPKPVQLGDKLDSRLVQVLFDCRRFQVIERSRLNQVLEEGKFQQNGLVDDAHAIKLGLQLGAKFVVVGSYTGRMTRHWVVENHFFSGKTRKLAFLGNLELDLRVVNTETGAIRTAMVTKAFVEGDGDGEGRPLDRLLDELTKKLRQDVASRFPIRGYLIKINETEGIIDLSGRVGVHPGDLFKVLVRGEDFVHPVTGVRMKGELRVVGQLVVVTPGEASSTVKVAEAKEPLKPGMIVESTVPKPPEAVSKP